MLYWRVGTFRLSTGVLVGSPGQTLPMDGGFRDGEDRLEVVEDRPLPYQSCRSSGRQPTGFGDRTAKCDDCGSSNLQPPTEGEGSCRLLPANGRKWGRYREPGPHFLA